MASTLMLARLLPVPPRAPLRRLPKNRQTMAE